MLAHSILSSSILKDADEKKIKRVIPKASNKIIDQTVARLYIAYPNPRQWQYTGLMGAIVLVDDLVGKSFFLKLVDIEGQRGVLWDQEVYVDFKYNQDRTFFHSFELEECLAGLLFADKSEAAHFYKRVTQRQKYGSKETVNNKAAIPRKVGLAGGPGGGNRRGGDAPPPPPPPASGPQAPLGPRGDASGVHRRRGQLARQIYYDDEPPVEWRPLYKDLAQMGISEDMIAANTQFIKDFINRQGGPLVGLEPPLPRKFAPKDDSISRATSSSSSATRAPPPPPPAPPQASSVAPTPPSTTTSSAPPPPPAPRQSQADGPVQDGSRSHFKIGGIFKGFGRHSESPEVQDSGPPTPTASTPMAPSMPMPGSAPPPAPLSAPATPNVPQGFDQPAEEPSPVQEPISVRRNVPPPFPGAGTRVSETVTARANKAPPPMPPREETSAPSRSSSGYSHGPERALPPRHPSGGAPPPTPSRPSHGGDERSKAPPLPPSRKAVPPPSPPARRAPAEEAPAAPPRPRAPTPPAQDLPPPAPPRPSESPVVTPPRAASRPAESYGHAPSQPPSAPPRAPPRPAEHSAAPPVAPPAPPRPPMEPDAGPASAPPAPPRPAPSSHGNAPPPPVRPDSSAAPPAAPPLPPSFGAPPAPGGGAPPPAPPPPPSFAPPAGTGGDGEAPAAVLSNDLLSSITQAGIGSLKKVDRSHLERPSALLQESKGSASPGSSAPAPGGGGDLAGALAAALSARKSKVTASDDEDEHDDDWD